VVKTQWSIPHPSSQPSHTNLQLRVTSGRLP